MLAWSIDIARASGCFDKILVSTDDAEIAAVAREWGADVPFLRDAELADDMTPTVPVIGHATARARDLGWDPHWVCCIYPCAPFIQAADLRAALQLLQSGQRNYVYPVVEYAHPVQRAMRRAQDGAMSFVQPDAELARTQDLEPLYHDAGQFYFGRAAAWLAQMKMHSTGHGLKLPAWRVVDIDTADDWKRAELLFPVLQASA